MEYMFKKNTILNFKILYYFNYLKMAFSLQTKINN